MFAGVCSAPDVKQLKFTLKLGGRFFREVKLSPTFKAADDHTAALHLLVASRKNLFWLKIEKCLQGGAMHCCYWVSNSRVGASTVR